MNVIKQKTKLIILDSQLLDDAGLWTPKNFQLCQPSYREKQAPLMPKECEFIEVVA